MRGQPHGATKPDTLLRVLVVVLTGHHVRLHAQEKRAAAAMLDLDARMNEQMRELAQLQGVVRKYLEAHNESFLFLHDAAETLSKSEPSRSSAPTAPDEKALSIALADTSIYA
jgi:hypothetical protein